MLGPRTTEPELGELGLQAETGPLSAPQFLNTVGHTDRGPGGGAVREWDP